MRDPSMKSRSRSSLTRYLFLRTQQTESQRLPLPSTSTKLSWGTVVTCVT